MSSGKTSPETASSSTEVPVEESRRVSALEEYELETDSRPAFILTWPEVKLLGIAGVRDPRRMRTRPSTHSCSSGRLLLGRYVGVEGRSDIVNISRSR